MKKSYSLIAGMMLAGIASFSQVRYVAANGSDAGDCSLPGSPCATIDFAVSQALAGDSVVLAPGNYTFAATQNIDKPVTVSAANINNKPVITSTASDVITINAANVTVNGLHLRMGLTSGTGLRGLVLDTQNDGIKLTNNEIVSIKTLSTGMVFEAYAIAAYGGNGNTVSIVNNEIKPNTLLNDAFGRGIALGISSLGNGAGGEIFNNTIQAYYPIQAVVTTADLDIEDNTFSGIVMIGYPATGVEINVTDNTFSGENDLIAANLYALLEVRAADGAIVNIENNTFEKYVNMGLFSSASNGVRVIDNDFNPSVTATNFASVHANTKLMTSGVQDNAYANAIEIKGNTFNAGLANNGAAIIYADHYGETSPAFSNLQVGGLAASDKNIFNVNLRYFIQLDSSSGNSDLLQLWSAYSVTTMKPFSQNVEALTIWNTYPNITTGELDEKIIDFNDNEDLGFVLLHPFSVSENKAINLTSFPNPTVDVLYVQATELSGKSTIKIMDIQGRVISSNNITSQGTLSIPVNELTAGIYTLQVENNGKLYNSRFVKN